MIKKDLAHIRKQFKLDHDFLKVFEILRIIIKDSNELLSNYVNISNFMT